MITVSMVDDGRPRTDVMQHRRRVLSYCWNDSHAARDKMIPEAQHHAIASSTQQTDSPEMSLGQWAKEPGHTDAASRRGALESPWPMPRTQPRTTARPQEHTLPLGGHV